MKKTELSVREKTLLTKVRNKATVVRRKEAPEMGLAFVSMEELGELYRSGWFETHKMKGIGKKTFELMKKLFAADGLDGIRSMSEAEYNAAEGIRRSDLWVMNDSPEKFKFRMDNPEETKAPALLFGSAAHKLVLEQGDFDKEYAVMPSIDRRTKEGKAVYEAFVAAANGKTVISQEDFDTIVAMRDALFDNVLAHEILYGKGGYNEIPFFWTDPDTGEKCKIKCDRVLKDGEGRVIVVDYKTAQYAQTENFNRAVIIHGYHVQAAMYTEGVQIALGLEKRPRFLFVAQEKKAPYSVNVIEVSYDVMNFGDVIYHELLGKYHDCKELDVWPGYTGLDGEINQTSLLKWAYNEMEEDE